MSREPLFLARETYRRRRLMDAARLLPFVGVFVFLLPALWAGAATTSTIVILLFLGWLALIVVAASVSGRLARHRDTSDGQDE